MYAPKQDETSPTARQWVPIPDTTNAGGPPMFEMVDGDTLVAVDPRGTGVKIRGSITRQRRNKAHQGALDSGFGCCFWTQKGELSFSRICETASLAFSGRNGAPKQGLRCSLLAARYHVERRTPML